MPVSIRRLGKSTWRAEIIGGQWLEGHSGHDPPPSYIAETASFAVLY